MTENAAAAATATDDVMLKSGYPQCERKINVVIALIKNNSNYTAHSVQIKTHFRQLCSRSVHDFAALNKSSSSQLTFRNENALKHISSEARVQAIFLSKLKPFCIEIPHSDISPLLWNFSQFNEQIFDRSNTTILN